MDQWTGGLPHGKEERKGPGEDQRVDTVSEVEGKESGTRGLPETVANLGERSDSW